MILAAGTLLAIVGLWDDFRALWAVDMGVHGNWVGIDAEGRTIIGRTLWAAFGGDGPFNEELAQLVDQRHTVAGPQPTLGPVPHQA